MALMVTGMSELAAGAMVAGSARLTFGTVQLLMFSLGILAANPLTAYELSSRIEVGMVHINDQTVDDEAVIPFGGIKASGMPAWGKSMGDEYIWNMAAFIQKLPTLDAAAKSTNGRVRFVAISQDMDPKKARSFFAERRLSTIEPMYDPQLGFSLALNANLPTTILYDKRGRELWRVTGERDWSSAESRALLSEV